MTLYSPAHRDDVLGKQTFRFRLREKQHERIVARNLIESRFDDALALTIDANPLEPPPALDCALREFVAFELLERSRMNDQRLREQGAVRRFVDDAIRQVEASRFGGHREAGWTRADDEHVRRSRIQMSHCHMLYHGVLLGLTRKSLRSGECTLMRRRS